jgi:hypothetical protein
MLHLWQLAYHPETVCSAIVKHTMQALQKRDKTRHRVLQYHKVIVPGPVFHYNVQWRG